MTRVVDTFQHPGSAELMEGKILFAAPDLRAVNGTTLSAVPTPVPLVDGGFDVDLPPGLYRARTRFKGDRSRSYTIFVPESDTEVRFMDLVTSYSPGGGGNLDVVIVSSGTEPRPSGPTVVLWVDTRGAGAARPNNMGALDLWFTPNSGGGGDTVAPSVPTGLASSSITTTGFTLTWNASTDDVAVTGYEVMLNSGTPVNATSPTKSFTGLTSGTDYLAQVRAYDATGNRSPYSPALPVKTSGPATVPNITTTTLNSIVVGTAFSQTLAATGTTPITWAVTTGTLPAGLSLSSAGAITGTPTTAGAYSFTVTATNSAGSDPQAYSGTVAASATAPVITTTTLSAMTVGSAFSQTLAATGSTPISFAVTTGTLPAGLSLSSAGALTGTPTTAGAYSFTVTATNSAGNDPQAYSGTVAAASLAGTLLGEWKFANNLNDTSPGGSHTATFTAGTGGGTFSYVTGPLGSTTALKFGASTHYLSYGYTGLQPSADGLTIMGWVKIDAGAANGVYPILHKSKDPATVSSRAEICVKIVSGVVSLGYIAKWKEQAHGNEAAFTPASPNIWHHVALVDSNSRYALLVDGVEQDIASRSLDNSTSPTWENYSWATGKDPNISDITYIAGAGMAVHGLRIIQGDLTNAQVVAWMNTA